MKCFPSLATIRGSIRSKLSKTEGIVGSVIPEILAKLACLTSNDREGFSFVPQGANERDLRGLFFPSRSNTEKNLGGSVQEFRQANQFPVLLRQHN